jgi:hypothetical protein
VPWNLTGVNRFERKTIVWGGKLLKNPNFRTVRVSKWHLGQMTPNILSGSLPRPSEMLPERWLSTKWMGVTWLSPSAN